MYLHYTSIGFEALFPFPVRWYPSQLLIKTFLKINETPSTGTRFLEGPEAKFCIGSSMACSIHLTIHWPLQILPAHHVELGVWWACAVLQCLTWPPFDTHHWKHPWPNMQLHCQPNFVPWLHFEVCWTLVRVFTMAIWQQFGSYPKLTKQLQNKQTLQQNNIKSEENDIRVALLYGLSWE